MFKKEMGQWIFKINKYLGMHYKQKKTYKRFPTQKQ